jgi:hypothetical protein
MPFYTDENADELKRTGNVAPGGHLWEGAGMDTYYCHFCGMDGDEHNRLGEPACTGRWMQY